MIFKITELYVFFHIASILSNDINNQNGICGALHLMTTTHEKFGDVRGAFQLAVSLKIVDFKVI